MMPPMLLPFAMSIQHPSATLSSHHHMQAHPNPRCKSQQLRGTVCVGKETVAHARHKVRPRLTRSLSQVLVRRHRRLLNPLQVLALDQALDALLDHVDVGFELRGELRDRLGEELCVRELFALSVVWSAYRLSHVCESERTS